MTMRFFNYRAALAAGLVLAAGAAACNNSDITSLNQNPNSPEDAPAGAVFTQATQTAVGRWLGSGYDLRQMEFVAQHLAEVQYPDEDRYARIRASDTQNLFQGAGGAYATSLEDFRQVVKKGEKVASAGIWAPASIMQQWEFGYLTDNWGDVPYSQALAGDSTGGSVLPAYDPQQAIYNGMFAKLTAASTALATPGAQSLGGADPIYEGSSTAWRKFANSLRARYAMRIVNVDPAKANAELTAALAAPGGVFTSNADMAKLDWPGDGVFNNPWANNFQTRDDHRMSKTFVDALVARNDPRLPVFAMPTVDFQNGEPGAAEYAGQPNGLDAATAGTYFTSTSRPGAAFYPGATAYGTYGGNGARQPSFLMTYAEVAFIKAEAAARSMGGLNPAQAAAFYNAGITASLEQWGITDAAAIAAYLAQPNVVYVGGVAGLKQIATQKWIALYTDGGQAWFEWRRTCTPTLVPGPAAIFSFVPRRLEYPTNELSVNKENVDAAIARQGADAMGTRVWWDKAGAPTCP
jgi:hypothetical protein